MLEPYMYRAGFSAGVISGVALGLLQQAAYLLAIMPFNIYVLTAGLFLPERLALSPFGLISGFVGHALFSGLLGILFAALLRYRLKYAIIFGAAYGTALLILLAGFFMALFTPEAPFWQYPLPALLFTVLSRVLYGAFLAYLYRRVLMLPTGSR